jgi:hypothetical protein
MEQAALKHAANDDAREPLIGLARLMRMAYSGVDLAPLGTQLIARAQRNPNDANALMDLATVLQLRGERELGLNMQAQALQIQQIYHSPTGAGTGMRLLAVVGPGDLMSNTPLEFLLEDSDVELDMLYVGPEVPSPPYLPDHDVLFVAIGESDRNLPVLQTIENVVMDWPRPVLNLPGRIARLSRDNACALLKSAPGVVMPLTVRIDRQALERVGQGSMAIAAVIEDGVFPVIVRPVDSHAGRGLARLDGPSAVADYLSGTAEDEFFISRFVDYRGADGLFRKYRIVLIEGRPFICHLAISAHWMIHYLNAGMAESRDKRDEEARCMAGFDHDFALRHAAVFRAISQCMGLDYLGIDCGETPDGELLVFEVDSNMIVHAMDPVEAFPYKPPQMRKVFAAFREMLYNASQRGQP